MGYKFLNSGSAAELHIFDNIGWYGTTASQFKTDLQAVGTKPLLVHINSQGGDPVDAQAIYNLLASRKNTTTRVVGMAASAASIIAQAGNPRQIVNNGWLMIHEPIVASASGNESAMRSAAEGLAAIKSGMAQTYATRSGKTIEEVQALMAAETWYTGQQAMDAGFADEVVDSVAMAASTTLDPAAFTQFKNTPREVTAAMNPTALSLGLPPAAAIKDTKFMSTFSECLKRMAAKLAGPSEREQRLVKILTTAEIDPEELLKAQGDDCLAKVLEASHDEAVAMGGETAKASLDAVKAALVSAGVQVDMEKPADIATAIQARLDTIASRKTVTLAASRGIAPQATTAGAVNGATGGAPKSYTQQCVEAL